MATRTHSGHPNTRRPVRRLESGLLPAAGRTATSDGGASDGLERPATRMRTPVARAAVVLAALAAGVLVIWGLKAGATTIGPVFLALVLTIAVHPAHVWARRHHWPAWLSVLANLVLVYVLLFGLSFAVLAAMGQLATILPTYADQAQAQVDQLVSKLDSLGVGATAQETMASALNLSGITDAILGLLSSVAALASSFFLVVVLLLFMAIDAAVFPTLLAMTRRLHANMADALTSFAHGTRRYLLVSTVFGFIVAVIDTVILYLAGIPAPVTWGILAFITNYIPNIGFVIGLIPPAILALLVGGPSLMLAVIALYCVVNFVIQSVIQPKIVGNAVGLSGTITMFSLVFWATVLGALGALLAIPLSLLAKALFVEADPQARWLLPLLAGRSDEPITDEDAAAVDPSNQSG
jgi:AI-2 transport protein TqsA